MKISRETMLDALNVVPEEYRPTAYVMLEKTLRGGFVMRVTWFEPPMTQNHADFDLTEYEPVLPSYMDLTALGQNKKPAEAG